MYINIDIESEEILNFHYQHNANTTCSESFT